MQTSDRLCRFCCFLKQQQKKDDLSSEYQMMQPTLTNHLKKINDIFPITCYHCFMNPFGECLAQTHQHDFDDEPTELFPVMISLRKVAIQFAMTLSQQDCPVVRVIGKDYVFSCYEIDDHVVALYTRMDKRDIEEFDWAQADLKMRPLLLELKHAV